MKNSHCTYLFITLTIALLVTVPTLSLGGDKVTICHYPPGNPENPVTMAINENALEEHLANGDTLGECPCPDTPCPAEVKVVNDSSQPVPVEGSVSVEGTSDVQIVNDSSHPVPVAGSVSIAGTPSVQIIDGKTPFQATIQCTYPSCGDVVIYTVPSGKLCVVEYFSCIAHSNTVTSGTAIVCQIATTVDGYSAQHSLPNSAPLTYGYLSTGQVVKIYASEGTPIYVDGYFAGDLSVFPDLWVSISGYCVDSP